MSADTTWDPVAFRARTQPDRIALRMGEERWSYARLEEAVAAAADSFVEQGLLSGEHVAVEFGAEEGLHFAVTLHALHRAGLLPVPMSQELSQEERVAVRQRAQVDFALTSAPVLESKPPARHRAGAESVPARRLDVPAAICFTSGTEGAARAVVLTHGNFLWSALASGRNLGVRAEDLWLLCLPLHHVGGLSVLTRSAYYGTAAEILPRFDPDAVNRTIDEHGVTLISLVPPMLERLIEARGAKRFPESLRAALVGGGPAPPSLLERAARLGLRALPTYGMTETTSQIATLAPGEWPEGLDTVGRPLPFARVEVRADDGAPLGPGSEGAIWVRGSMVAEAYFDHPDPAAGGSPFDRRWFRTGDVGVWDERGRLRVLDRRQDRIVVGGENVSPREVEEVLARHPSVREVCVAALPAGSWGHEIAAVIIPRGDQSPTLEELRAFGARQLASFKLPRRLVIVDALPRNVAGKVLRSEVRSRLAEEMAEENRA